MPPKLAARDAVRLLYGAALLTFSAAFIESLWSPLRSLPFTIKIGAGVDFVAGPAELLPVCRTELACSLTSSNSACADATHGKRWILAWSCCASGKAPSIAPGSATFIGFSLLVIALLWQWPLWATFVICGSSLFDRVLLKVFAEASFGAAPNVRDVWRALPGLIRHTGLLSA